MTKIKELREMLRKGDPVVPSNIIELLDLVEMQHQLISKMEAGRLITWVADDAVEKSLKAFENWNKP